MSKRARLMIVLAVVAAAVVMVRLGGPERHGDLRATPETTTAPEPSQSADLPRLVDLGSDRCIPCKKMAPILAGLEEEFAGRLRVEVIDVRRDPAAVDAYGIRVIPTQIFYDATGRELRRHEGFISRAAILAAWDELGVDLGAPATATAPPGSPTTDR